MSEFRVLFLVIWLGTTWGFVPNYQGKVKTVKQWTCLSSETTGFSTDPEDATRSIGDVVQGLHGGKYQFDEASPISFEGRQFAEMSYSSGSSIKEDNFEDEPLPKWALRLKEMAPLDVLPSKIAGEVIVDDAQSGTIKIQNDERSWEKYYAFVVGDQASSFVVNPFVGMLAPRGGANEFSDSAVLEISAAEVGCAVASSTFVVVGTEAETWTYQIQS